MKINYKFFTLTVVGFIFTFGVLLSFYSDYNPTNAKKIYIDHCSKCHRKNGTGIKNVYPPLKNADYIQKGNPVELLRGMLYGRSGNIIVNGVKYQGVMITEIEGSVKDEDIANLLTYIYKEFNSINTIVTVDDVKKARKAGKLPEHK